MSKSARIVFLVDVNHSEVILDLETEIEKRTQSIRLSCLKLINYFIHRRLKNYTKVQWGYKFYSSNSSEKHYRSHRQSFIDFELEHFEEFEQSLSSCVKKNAQIEQNGVAKCSQSHAQYLNIILREVLYDFDWDSPDISTPDKIRRKSARENDLDKFVFLISKCPWSRDDLFCFLGQQQLNCSLILSPILMSSAVVNSYVKKYEIKLFWLDVDDDNLLTENEVFDGYQAIRGVLKRINGNIIAVSTLLDTSKPFESILDWYFKEKVVVNKFDADLHFKADVLKMELFTLENSNIFEFSELMQTNSQFHPMLVTGTSYKELIASQCTLGCLASEENKEKFYHLLRILLNNNLNLLININNCCGILYAVSPTLAILCFMDIFPQKVPSVDRKIAVKKGLDYPLSLGRLKILNERNEIPINFVERLIEQKQIVANLDYRDGKPEITNQFSFNMLTKWFLPNSVSFQPKFEVETQQNPIIKREEEIFARLAARFNKKETLPNIEYKSDVATTLPIHLPKISSNLNVSERSSGLVKQSLLNLKAKNEEAKNDDEAKRKPKPQRRSRERKSIETNGKFNLNDEDKLIEQLKEYCNETVQNNDSLLTCAENVINVVIHHVQMSGKDNGDDIAARLLSDELLKTPAMIGKEYENSDSDERNREYELQALLRMEAITAKVLQEESREKIVEEVIMLIRTLSFYSSPIYLSVFLKETLLPNYTENSRESVISIFEELNQPLPPELDSQSSSEEEIETQNQNVNDNKTANDSDYLSHNSASTSSSSLTSNKTRKTSLPLCTNRLGGMQKRTITITAKQKARLKLKVQTSSSVSDVIPKVGKKEKRKKTSARKSLFGSTTTFLTPSKSVNEDVFVCETPMEEIKKKFAKSRRNIVIEETPHHKLAVARRLYTSESQPPRAVNERAVTSSHSRQMSQSLTKVRRILSSPAKLNPNENSDSDVDYIDSSPISKGQTSPEPLRLPAWKILNSTSTSSSSVAPLSPEIDFKDELETSNKDDDVFVEKSENSCNNSVNGSPFDAWKRTKPRSETFSLGERCKRKSENVEPQSKKRAKSEIFNGNMSNSDVTPTKNGTGREKPNFTSPSSLSLLHIITSPVKNRKIRENSNNV